ncbi:3-oxoacyl-[acyl-carrier-protein] synthase-1 [Reichenbachiella faecimaris]|uniref:3-oxoacyl-[acyl-carrier-protein] synthase-1 n=1 Tax=Reichenbachiella faecimaris TaxID=692418 RepID=A0A1W2G756_REIFA|nr:beta-ketoacyl-[acyl-carrier-protein] synthase family protein [Reichenbachiella faecimaris]SMD32178.1 3-oxoacyl-[acyl-carrier-protein] synthase-1 [Reichenbachiella faecimaris]
MKIFVTGMGVVSAAGFGLEENLASLQSSKTGIASCDFDQIKGICLGRVEQSTEELRHQLKLSGQWPRTAMLGLAAAKQAYAGSERVLLKTGFINGTTTGGMDLSEQYFSKGIEEQKTDGWKAIATHDLGSVTNLIAKELGTFDYVNTISTACSSAASSIMLGARLIKAGTLDRVLVGGCDALTLFTINGFKSLMIYDPDRCKPFDQNRQGLNLGEGAGYLLLESETAQKQSGKKAVAELTGWANANDAYHQTGTSAEGIGANLAMQKALTCAQLAAEEIDYLNAHGTATNNNDQSESAAIDAVFDQIDFSSLKSLTGHTLGASGGIEAIYSIMSLQQQLAWANENCTTPMENAKNRPIQKLIKKSINHVMSNSFGFGGNSTSLIFSKA